MNSELIMGEMLNSLVLHGGSARKNIHTCCQPFLHDAPNRKRKREFSFSVFAYDCSTSQRDSVLFQMYRHTAHLNASVIP